MRLAVVALLAALAAPVSAQETAVRHRLPLPLDGGVDLARLAAPGDDPVRVVLTGTLSSRVDGAEIDALSARTPSGRFEGGGPFVTLPGGATAVSADAATNRYVFDVPRAPVMPIGLRLGPLAQRHLISASELRDGITGAIVLEVLEPVAAAAPARVNRLSPWPVAGFLGAGLAMLALFALLAVRARRRARIPEEALMRRAWHATRVIRKESRGLGRQFRDVVAAAGRLLDTAGRVRQHATAARDALARTRELSSPRALRRRSDLVRAEREAMARLEDIVERLEETATQLAGHAAGQARVGDVDLVVSLLDLEVEAAVEADHEARAIA